MLYYGLYVFLGFKYQLHIHNTIVYNACWYL